VSRRLNIVPQHRRHQNDRRLEARAKRLSEKLFATATKAGFTSLETEEERVRIPRDGERGFHGIVNTDSTAT